MRDRQLDIYRAIVMIYIVCVIHCCYLFRDAQEPLLSLFLFAMPLIFFISGASLSVSRSRRGLLETVKNRFRRVVAPYYIYACVLIVTGIVLSWGLKLAGLTRYAFFDITRYDWEDCIDILLGRYIPQFSFMWHLWFILPYFILSCTFPLQIKLMGKVNRMVYLALCLILFLIVQALPELSLLKQVLCFNVFMVAGYLFYKRVKTSTLVITALAALVAILVYTLGLGGDFCPMQDHKFPPDWIYLTYNILALSVLSITFSRITLRGHYVLDVWNTRGYTIYLYQSVVFSITSVVRQQLPIAILTPLPLRFLIDATLVFLLSTALSYLTHPLERWVMKKLDSNHS